LAIPFPFTADLFVDAKEVAHFPTLRQVDLVGAHDGGNVLELGAHQQPVEHAQAWLRIGTGKDENGLVRIGHDDLFSLGQIAIAVPAARAAPAGSRSQSRQRPLSLSHLFDHPAAVLGQADAHPVADGHQICIAALFLEPSAYLAGEITLVCMDGEKAALGFGDQAV
jgi:hypothetical protein